MHAARYNIMRCNKFITTHQNLSSDEVSEQGEPFDFGGVASFESVGERFGE